MTGKYSHSVDGGMKLYLNMVTLEKKDKVKTGFSWFWEKTDMEGTTAWSSSQFIVHFVNSAFNNMHSCFFIAVQMG